MKLNNWPSGTRDVTEAPTFELTITEIESSVERKNNKAHFEGFLQLDGTRISDHEDQESRTGLSITPQRFRSYRKLYEHLGLVYRDGEILRLSKIGARIKNFAADLTDRLSREFDAEKKNFEQDLRKSVISVLARDQLDNPTESQRANLPDGCDVFPFRCIWTAMIELDSKIHYEEVNRVILHVMKMIDLPEAIDRIRKARLAVADYQASSDTELSKRLGPQVFTDQVSARISPWFSMAGWGGLVIERDNRPDGFRHLVDLAIPHLKSVLSIKPVFFKASSELEWLEHYLGPELQDTSDAKFNLGVLVNDLSEAGFYFGEMLVRRFVACCQTKPFVILTGLSGSGKTKLAQAFAMWICENNDQYRLVPVGADWTNREPLLGFPNALSTGEYVKPENGVVSLIVEASKPENENKPYFLILDEMNLSHVERYFADFLSVMESGGAITLHSGEKPWGDVPPKLSFPKNLFVIGTVNIDETTYMFSPKVLDRANVIEFRVTSDELKAFLSKTPNIDLSKLEGGGTGMAADFVALARNKDLTADGIADDVNAALMTFFDELRKAGAEFGYRTASEITRFAVMARKVNPGWKMDEIIDAAIMQKLLPKVHGSRKKIEDVLKTLIGRCLVDPSKIDEHLKKTDDAKLNENVRYKISYEKLIRMYHNLLSNGFTSYAEA